MNRILNQRKPDGVIQIYSDDGEQKESVTPVKYHIDSADIPEVITGLKNLHKLGITVLDVKFGKNEQGQIRIIAPETFGFEEVLPVNTRYNLPEKTPVKFKSDLWCLGCAIIGKNIPNRFMNTQASLDMYISKMDNSEILKHLFKLDPSKRDFPHVKEECIIC